MMVLKGICRNTTILAAIAGVMVAKPCASSSLSDQEIYRCSSPNGYSDAKALSMLSGESDISGKLLLHSADVGARWGSIGKILVHQHGAHYGEGDCGCNGITVYAFKNPDHVEFDITANGKDEPIAESSYGMPTSFRISVSPQGVMTVAIGEADPKIKTVKLLHAEHDTLEMSCSGTDISFLGIYIQ